LRYQHRRGELLDAVGDYVLEQGVANLSLRRIGEAVGVSHVTLQHHFGSKEQLVAEIVEHLLERTFMPPGVYTDGTPDPGLDLEARFRALWAHLSSPAGRRDVRLFVEVLGQSLYADRDYAPAVARSISHRVELITANVVKLGCPPQEAPAHATLLLAQWRGLVLDALATDDRARVEAAFELALQSALRQAEAWSTAPS
jgi:AcrR family transcriptional regulator